MGYYNPFGYKSALAAGMGMLQRQRSASGIRSGARLRNGSSNTMTYTKKKKTFGRRKSFAAKLLSVEPAKHYSNTSLTNLLHNNISTVIPTAGITQGDTNATRTGDFVHLAAIKIKCSFQTPVAANGYTYRVLVGYTGEEYNLPATLGTGLTATELFIPNTSGTWTPNGLINPKAFTCLYDETMDVNSQVAAVSDVASESFTVQLDKRFPYQADASIYGKNQNLAIVVIGAVIGGVTGVASCGVVVLTYDLIFKEI